MSGVYLNTEQYCKHNPQFKFEEDSLERRIKDVVYKVILSCWRTLGNYFSTVELNQDQKTLLRRFQGEKEESNKLAALEELKHQRKLAPASIDTLHQEYLSKIPEDAADVELVSNFLHDLSSSELTNHDKEIVLIPVVLEGLFGDHIVAVVFDKAHNRVELYDSNGLTSKDHSESIRCSEENLKLSTLLVRIAQTYGDEKTTLWENTKKHQYDCHNCGVYVLDYFERRLFGYSPDEITSKGRTFEEVNQTLRNIFIHILLLPPEEASKEGGNLGVDQRVEVIDDDQFL